MRIMYRLKDTHSVKKCYPMSTAIVARPSVLQAHSPEVIRQFSLAVIVQCGHLGLTVTSWAEQYLWRFGDSRAISRLPSRLGCIEITCKEDQ